jgi:NADH-quinone oxidoreductase subunit C
VIRLSSTVDADSTPATDDLRDELLSRLQTALGDAVVGSHLVPGDDLWVRISTEAWVAAHRAARDTLQMDYFCFLSALDWKPSPFGKGEDDPTEPPVVRDMTVRPGVTGGDTRFQVFSRLYSVSRHVGITLKVDVAEPELSIDTISELYLGANWHERECHEMFGITFNGHPDLRNLYLPGDFEGYPLRKDFPLLARIVKPWPGIVDVEPMPGEDPTPDSEAAPEAAAAEGIDAV